MKEIKSGPKWLYFIFWFGVRWKLLFPEQGKNIPFTIKNSALVGSKGEDQVHWERIFYFGKKKRYFNALMSVDKKRHVIRDYLGEPQLLYSDLIFIVNDEGHLIIRSSRQKLVLGKFEIPLPKVFQGLATVIEKYDEKLETYQIHVAVRNQLIGTVFSYKGEFVPDDHP